MKKLLLVLVSLALVLCTTACGDAEATVKTTEIKANGYGGEMVLNLTTKGEEIVDIELVSSHETEPVIERAFPILRERILEAQSPVVDNVSGATFASFGIKKAVAEQMKAEGKDFGEITMTTEPEHEKKQLENVTTDLVIVGGGPAGIASALAAKEHGVKNVIVIEKLDILSGNGKFDQDFNRLYNSKQTQIEGTNMTKEEFIASRVNNFDSPERVQAWADKAWDLDEWLRAQGTELNYIIPGSVNDHMAEFDKYAGNEIQTNMEKALAATDVDVRTGTKGLDLIFDGDTVVGVKVESRDGYYDINAKAVILSTGGFSWNKELLNKYAPGHDDWTTSNQMGATGDFVPVFEEHNFGLGQMNKLVEFANVILPERHLTGGANGYVRVTKDGVNAKKGPETNYYITDQGGYDSHWRIQKHTAQGFYTKYETLKELAEGTGINYDNLLNTITEYNAGRAEKGARQLATEVGPFYVCPTVSMVHMTLGGVMANGQAQVLTADNEVVPGLYAAGEVVATDSMYAGAVVFGRVAGEATANFILGE